MLIVGQEITYMKYLFLFACILSSFLTLTTLTAPQSYADCIPFVSAPNLYEVDRVSSTSATLYFTPLNDSIQSYKIDYGLSEDDRRYSVIHNAGSSTGAIAYTVQGLDPSATYFYTVSATNSCSGSPWSNWVSDAVKETTTTGGTDTTTPSNGPIAGSNELILGAVLSSLLLGGGIFLYRKSSVVSSL